MSNTEGPCGCAFAQFEDGEEGDLVYCPLHAEAPAMLEALRHNADTLDLLALNLTAITDPNVRADLHRIRHGAREARSIIARAEGKA